MNRKIIQKVIDELGKETPDLSYIRGVLETYIEGLPADSDKLATHWTTDAKVTPVVTTATETKQSSDSISDMEIKAKLAAIKPMLNV